MNDDCDGELMVRTETVANYPQETSATRAGGRVANGMAGDHRVENAATAGDDTSLSTGVRTMMDAAADLVARRGAARRGTAMHMVITKGRAATAAAAAHRDVAAGMRSMIDAAADVLLARPDKPAATAPRARGSAANIELAPATDLWDAESDLELPAISRKQVKPRVRTKRNRPRSKTIALKRLTRAELQRGALANPPVDDAQRPQTRAECHGAARPCPWVACKHHLYLDINPRTGSIKINFPDLEPWELQHTCALDVADNGGLTLEEIGLITNLTRERVRQVEVRGLLTLRTRSNSLK